MMELAKKLSSIDELETWKEHCNKATPKKELLLAFELAKSLWLERMISERKLLVHPEVISQLIQQKYITTDVHNRMIWASVLASAEGTNSKERFKSIKKKLLKKYGRDWWEDVYKRQKNAFAAKERIRRTTSGTATSALISNTILFSNAANSEIDKALRMIPAI